MSTQSLNWRDGLEIVLDPDATRDYRIDWTRWLGTSGNAVASVQAVAASGISASIESSDSTSAVLRVTGGTIEAGAQYTDRAVTVRATFADGQVDDWTITFRVREK